MAETFTNVKPLQAEQEETFSDIQPLAGAGVTSAAGTVAGSQAPEPSTWDKTKGALGSAWNFINKPLVQGTGAEQTALKQARDYSTSAPTKAEEDSPNWAGMKRGAAGAYADTVDTLKGFTSPLGLATLAAGPLAEGETALAKGAGAASKLMGVGFGAQGVNEAVKGGTSMVQEGANPENEKQLFGGAGQAILGGSVLLHGTPMGTADINTDAGAKTANTGPVRAAAKAYNVGREVLPYVAPIGAAIEGAYRGGPVGGAEGAAYGSYAGNRLAKLLPEANETVGLPPEQANLANLRKAAKPITDKLTKAQAAYDMHDATRAAGNPTPEDVMNDLEKAKQEYMQHMGYVDLAEQHAANIKAGRPSVPNEASQSPASALETVPTPKNLPASQTGEALGGSALRNPLETLKAQYGKNAPGTIDPNAKASETGEALATAYNPPKEITAADVKSSPGTSMSPEGRAPETAKAPETAFKKPEPVAKTPAEVEAEQNAAMKAAVKKPAEGGAPTADDILFQRAKAANPNGTPGEWAKSAQEMKTAQPQPEYRRPAPFDETAGANETIKNDPELSRRSTDNRRSTDTGYVRPQPFETVEGANATLKNDPALQEFYRREEDVKPEVKAEEPAKEEPKVEAKEEPEAKPEEKAKEEPESKPEEKASNKEEPRDNKSLADTFRKNADLLESEGGDPFRLRAYRNAADAIEAHPQKIADLVKEDPNKVSEIPGIGKSALASLQEMLKEKGAESSMAVHPDFKEQLSLHGNENLKVLGKKYGLDPEKYDFKKREALREGGQKHPTDRIRFVNDLYDRVPPEERAKVEADIKKAEGSEDWENRDQSQLAKRDRAEEFLSKLKDLPRKIRK